MNYTNPNQIGIVACPGGKVFADKIISHLQDISKQEFDKKVDALESKYRLSRAEVIQKLQLDTDLRLPTTNLSNPGDDCYPQPHFKVDARFIRFSNGEFKTEIHSCVRDKDVYIVQDVANPYPITFEDSEEAHKLSINDHIFCLLVTVDAILQAAARRVTLVIPSYPYARQHKKKFREGLAAARFGQLMEYMGVTRIITLDIHSREIENTFNKLRLENLHASYQIIKTLNELVGINNPDLMVVSPDTGSIVRNKFYSDSIQKPLGLIYKERDYTRVGHDAKKSNIVNTRLLGNVKDKIVLMGDDILGTGGTMLKALAMLKEQGAREIYCGISLPLFNGEAICHFDEAYQKGMFNRVIGTNAVYHDTTLTSKEWYLAADVSRLFAQTIFLIHHNQSISVLLDNREIITELLARQ
jgi:ribose-phosphate pyrophosphokinase